MTKLSERTVGSLTSKSGYRRRVPFEELIERPIDIRCLLNKDIRELRRITANLHGKEGIRCQALKFVRAECTRGEMTAIIADDPSRAALHGRSQNVPVFWIIPHGGNEFFVILRECIRKHLHHCMDAAIGLPLCEPKLEERARQLRQNMRRPLRNVKSLSLGQSQQRIHDRHWRKHARIEDSNPVFSIRHLVESCRRSLLWLQLLPVRELSDGDADPAPPYSGINPAHRFVCGFPPCERRSHLSPED